MDAILAWMGENPVIVIIIVIVLFAILTYNSLNAKRQRVKKSFSKIDVYLEKRFDEISSLLDQTMSAYDHESDVYVNLSRLRTGITKAQEEGSINSKVQAANQIQTVLASPAIRTEAYPQLQAITSLGVFTAKETAQLEDQLAAARLQYNSNATSYNTKITSFPAIIFAKLFGFSTPFELFEANEQKRERPISSTEQIRNAQTDIKIEQMKKEAAAQAEIDSIKHEAELLAAKAELEKQKQEFNNITENNTESDNNQQ